MSNSIKSVPENKAPPRFGEILKKQERGEHLSRSQFKNVTDKRVRRALKDAKKRDRQVSKANAEYSQIALTENGGFLQPESIMERTWKVRQHEIHDHAELATQRKMALQLDLQKGGLGPFRASYSRNGRFLLITGRKGQVSIIEWQSAKLISESFLNQTIRDSCFLHSDLYFALAQSKHVHIYDNRGTELHKLRDHGVPIRIGFLPYHFLLASVSENGVLKYTDTTTGEQIAQWRSRLGRCEALAVNPSNACIHLGHNNGTVTIWSPNVSEPLARMLVHSGRVNAVKVDVSGNYMVSGGFDGKMKIWDIRVFKELHSYSMPRPPSDIDISHRGLVAVGYGPHVQVWKDVFKTARSQTAYMKNTYERQIVETVNFCPYEDVLGVAHSGGFATMIVPGAGEPNFDSRLPNPFETKRQRREREIHSLLDKLAPETIALDIKFVGSIEKDPQSRLDDIRQLSTEQKEEKRKKSLERKRAKGGNQISKQLGRKESFYLEDQKEMLRERLERDMEHQRQKNQLAKENIDKDETIPSALKEFYKRANT